MNAETKALDLRVLDQMRWIAETTNNPHARENYELLKALVDRLLGYDEQLREAS